MNDAVYHQYARVLHDHWWTRARRRQVESLLARDHIEPDGSRRVLEIGCGSGTEYDFLARFGPVTGVELSPVGLEYCQGRGYEELLQENLNAYEPEAGSFDLIVDFHVLYHQWIDEPRHVLTKLRKALTATGKLVFSEPAFELFARSHDRAGMTQRRWSRGALRALLRSAGFRVERMVGFTCAAVPAVSVSAFLDRFRSREPTQDIHELNPPSPLVDKLANTVMAVERGINRVCPLPLGVAWIGVAS